MFDGDGFAAKSAVFRAHIAGPPDLPKKLFDLPEGTRVHVEGAIERRSHNLPARRRESRARGTDAAVGSGGRRRRPGGGRPG
jgi:hypothetical protein